MGLLVIVVDPGLAVGTIHMRSQGRIVAPGGLLKLLKALPLGPQMVDVRTHAGCSIERTHRHEFVGSHRDRGIVVVKARVLVLCESLFLQFQLKVVELRHEARIGVNHRSRFPHKESGLIEVDSELVHDKSDAEGAAA